MTALEHLTQLREYLDTVEAMQRGYAVAALYEVRRELPKIERKMRRELKIGFTSASGKK